MFILVAVVGAGLFLIVTLLFTVFCLCVCCCLWRRKTKSVRVDQYSLLSKDGSSDWAGDE